MNIAALKNNEVQLTFLRTPQQDPICVSLKISLYQLFW